jgi:hypothetical protein
LALGAGEGEVVGELAARGRIEPDQADQKQDPANEDAAATAVHRAGETLEHGSLHLADELQIGRHGR